MMDLAEPYGPILRGIVLAAAAILWTVMLARVVGLRAFSKMTAFDFVATVATGSLIAQAATRTDWASFIQSLAGVAGVFLIQFVLAKLRQRSDTFQELIRNHPVLLMENGEYLDDALHATRVSRSNVEAKLRSANVASRADVRAVVLETTGDISVIQADNVDEEMLEGVERI